MARRGARGAGGGRALTARGPRAVRTNAAARAAGNGRVEVAEKLLAAGAAVGATSNVRAPRAGEGVAGGVCQHRFRAGSVLVSPFSLGGGRRIGGRERGPGAHDGSSRGAGRGAGGRSPRGPRAGRIHAAALGCGLRSRGGGGEAARGGRGRRRHETTCAPLARGRGSQGGVVSIVLGPAPF